MTIKTKAGDFELVPAQLDQLRGLAHYWPMEVIQDKDTPGRYGLVFQHVDEEEEVHGIKLQMVDAPRQDAITAHGVYRALIAVALPHYLAKQHRGVMVPCAYFKEKQPGLLEAGIALFVGPDPASQRPIPRDGLNFDDRLGEGATQMVLDMISAIARAAEEYRQPPITLIGIDLRPRLQIGSIVIHFVIQGSAVIAAKDLRVEDDPVWEYVVRAGFSSLPYAPMTPTGLLSKFPPDASRI